MTIAITSNTSWNIYNFRLGLIKHFQSLGHTVLFFSPLDDYALKVIEQTNAKHVPVINLERKGKNPFKDIELYMEFKQLYKKHKIDIALHYTIKPNIYGSLASKHIGIKCISNVTGLGFIFLKNSFINKAVKQFFKFALNKSNKIVLQNDIDRDLFIENNFFKIDKLKMIYGSGVNTAFFTPVQNTHLKNKFVFLFIGRLLFDKGVIELFEAFNKLSNANLNIELHIVGEIDNDNPSAISRNKLDLILNENSSIKYFGKTDNVKSNISNANCVVLPSYREGLPKSLLEAMSMAKPIITTNAPGCSQLINGNGFLCEPKSWESLFEKMNKILLLNEAQLIEMGNQSRKLVLENYDEKIIVKNYEALINSLLQ